MQVLLVIIIVCLQFALTGCRMIMERNGTSQLSATDVLDQEDFRCKNIYPKMYDVTVEILAAMSARYQDMQDGKDQMDPPLHHSNAALILQRNYTMLQNIMRNRSRPIDPVAFFSVIKDFETSTTLNQWTNEYIAGVGRSGFQKEGIGTQLCSSGVCSGKFQVDVIQENALWKDAILCEKNGLNLTPLEGALDFCALFFWLHVPLKTGKCDLFLWKNELVPVADRKYNPCIKEGYAWTEDTFAVAWRDAYIQANAWEIKYGAQFHYSWRDMYQGGTYNGQTFQGYEHCAIEHYLKTYWSVPDDYKAPADISSYRRILRMAVRQFGYNIGILPSWSNPDWKPDLVVPTKDGVTLPLSGENWVVTPSDALKNIASENAASKARPSP